MDKKLKNVYLPGVRMTADLRDQIRSEAERKQTSISALIREAIILYFAENK